MIISINIDSLRKNLLNRRGIHLKSYTKKVFNLKNSDDYIVLRDLSQGELWRYEINNKLPEREIYRILDSLLERNFISVCDEKQYRGKTHLTKKYRLTLKGFLASVGSNTLSKKHYVIQKYLQLIPESFRENIFFYIKKDIQLFFIRNYKLGLELQNIQHLSEWLNNFNQIHFNENDKTIQTLEQELWSNYTHNSRQFLKLTEKTQKNNILCSHFASWAEIIYYLLLDYSPKKIENILQANFDLTTDPKKYYEYFKQNESIKNQDTLWNERIKLRDKLRGEDFMKKVAKMEKADLLKKSKS